MSANVTRRRFLQISATTFGAASGGALIAGAANGSADAPQEKGLRTVATTCDVCFWKCGAIATVRDGKLWKIEGNPDDPLSRGRLCTRGTGGIGAHYDPDRLKSPLIRVGERGKEQWKVATWDEALAFVAQKMQAIKAAHGPESVAMFNHGIGARPFTHLMKAFGAINFAAPSFAQCRGPRDIGFTLTFGDSVGSPERTDIENTRCLVLIGSHIGENMHNSQVQEFATAVGRGASVIVVDPRFSVAASKAKHYLPIRAGTDLALLLAWMRVIVRERLYDAEFVAKHGEGFDKFAAELEPYTPEWAQQQTGVDAALIRASAREMASHRPATIVHPGRRSSWYGDNAQRSRAVALLNALMGNWGRRGGIYMPASMSVPKYPTPPYPKSTRPPADRPADRFPFADEGITTAVREATITGKPYPIKGWMVVAVNLIQALPNREETLKAIEALDLLVVVDTMPSEIAGYADVVLPEATYLERWDDINVETFKEPFIAIRQPVVAPPADQKGGSWIARQLAEKLGLAQYFPWKDLEDQIARRLRDGGYDFEQLKKAGILKGPRKPVFVEDGVELEFETPSKKVEFWSRQLADAGFDPVPKYVAPPAAPAGMLRLISGRAPMHTFSRTQTNPLLHALMPENEVWINAAVASEAGLKSGDRVRLKNQDGVVSTPVRVKATQRIHPECVYMVYGFGHTSRALRSAYGKGASAAQLVTRYRVDPLMGGTSIHDNFVSFEQV
ncbi:MAG: molybdopterin-dependent oxidoreductase [Burkholderiaceae bacterium]